jgi:tripartite-type tricarboxylate transporter receptor subunit TctC
MGIGAILAAEGCMNSLQRAWLTGLLLATSAWAQDPAPGYPRRPIRLIVPFSAGGAGDACSAPPG